MFGGSAMRFKINGTNRARMRALVTASLGGCCARVRSGLDCVRDPTALESSNFTLSTVFRPLASRAADASPTVEFGANQTAPMAYAVLP
jgi:hypothetical protein